MGLPFCPQPFSHFRVSTVGDLSICSPSRLKIPVVGNVLRTDAQTAWNSASAQQLRQSILDGTYEYCSSEHCPALQKKSLPDRDRIEDPRLRHIIDNQLTVLETGPTELNLHYDRSCNLKCPSCRTEIIGIKDQELDRATRVRDSVMDSGIISDAELVTLCGYGEVFSSKVHLGLLRRIDQTIAPNLRIKLLTNGLLLNEAMWNSFENAHPMIDEVWVSIDAATPETYALNRGGKWDVLMQNLEFISGLRQSGAFKRFYISFVVQANNYREMPDFVTLGTSLKCDGVFFQKLFDSDNAYMEDFDDRAIHKPDHPEHEAFLELLKRKEMKRRIVDLYTISDVLKANTKTKPIERRAQSQPPSVRLIDDRPPQAASNGHYPNGSVVNGHYQNGAAPNGHYHAHTAPVAHPAPPPQAPPEPEFDFREPPIPVDPSPFQHPPHTSHTPDPQIRALQEENQHLRKLLVDALLKLAKSGQTIE